MNKQSNNTESKEDKEHTRQGKEQVDVEDMDQDSMDKPQLKVQKDNNVSTRMAKKKYKEEASSAGNGLYQKTHKVSREKIFMNIRL